jgi:hypothetical protein
MIELPDGLACNFRDKGFRRRDGSQKRIPSFVSPAQFIHA